MRSIYCLSEGERQPVKIGISQRPRERFECVRAETWRDMSISWTVGGCHSDEQVCHRILADFLIRGEWFRDPDDAIKNLATRFVQDLHASLRQIAGGAIRQGVRA